MSRNFNQLNLVARALPYLAALGGIGIGLAGSPATAAGQAPVPREHTEITTPNGSPPGTTTPLEVLKLLPTAWAAWPDSECAGKESIEILPPEDVYITDDQGNRTPEGGVAYRGDCAIKLSNKFHGYYLCAVLTHEEDHLAGEEHSPEPESIMYGGILPPDYAPCLEVTVDKQWRPYRILAQDAAVEYIPELASDPEGVTCDLYPRKRASIICYGLGTKKDAFYRVRMKSHYTKDGVPQFTAQKLSKPPKGW